MPRAGLVKGFPGKPRDASELEVARRGADVGELREDGDLVAPEPPDRVIPGRIPGERAVGGGWAEHGVSIGGGELPALDGPLAEVQRATFARVPDALTSSWRDGLLSEVDDHRFDRVVEQVGPVRQQAEELALPLDELRYPVTVRLASALRRAVFDCSLQFPGVARFVPNEAVYLRYRGPAAGISPHRDHIRYVVLVAVFTLHGEAQFSIVSDRAGKHVLARWHTAPGDLVLLRAPGFAGDDDRRPLHVVGPSTGHERISLTLRMDTRTGDR